MVTGDYYHRWSLRWLLRWSLRWLLDDNLCLPLCHTLLRACTWCVTTGRPHYHMLCRTWTCKEGLSGREIRGNRPMHTHYTICPGEVRGDCTTVSRCFLPLQLTEALATYWSNIYPAKTIVAWDSSCLVLPVLLVTLTMQPLQTKQRSNMQWNILLGKILNILVSTLVVINSQEIHEWHGFANRTLHGLDERYVVSPPSVQHWGAITHPALGCHHPSSTGAPSPIQHWGAIIHPALGHHHPSIQQTSTGAPLPIQH